MNAPSTTLLRLVRFLFALCLLARLGLPEINAATFTVTPNPAIAREILRFEATMQGEYDPNEPFKFTAGDERPAAIRIIMDRDKNPGPCNSWLYLSVKRGIDLDLTAPLPAGRSQAAASHRACLQATMLSILTTA
jgi:hypothetical protein